MQYDHQGQNLQPRTNTCLALFVAINLINKSTKWISQTEAKVAGCYSDKTDIKMRPLAAVCVHTKACNKTQGGHARH